MPPPYFKNSYWQIETINSKRNNGQFKDKIYCLQNKQPLDLWRCFTQISFTWISLPNDDIIKRKSGLFARVTLGRFLWQLVFISRKGLQWSEIYSVVIPVGYSSVSTNYTGK